jgi:hypothetical protein
MRRTLTWKAALLALIVALAATVAGLAYSSTTSSSSSSAVKGCYDPGSRSLRAVGSLAECSGNETAIDWNQVVQAPVALPSGRTAVIRVSHFGPIGP